MALVNLEFVVSSAEPSLTTVGDVFRKGAGSNTPPVVTDVIARNTRTSRFLLSPGDYVYHFHVEQGFGKFTVLVRPADSDDSSQALEMDTRLGFNGRTYPFSVAAAAGPVK